MLGDPCTYRSTKAMSTDLKAPPSPQPDDAEETDKKKIFDLSLTQIVGGALAAMTAAALGSTLGVAGTIAGAALASVIAGVAGSLYTASLRTGRERVRTAFRGATDAATAPPAPVDPVTTVVADRVVSDRGVSDRAVDETQLLPAWDPLPLDQLEKPARTNLRSKQTVSLPWRRAIAVSLSVFALAAVLITGYERVSGASLSGGTGTTVSEVGRGSSGSTPKSKPSSATSSSTSPSSEPSSAAPSAGTRASSEPSGSASDSTAPSAAASTPAVSDTPSAAVSPAG